MTTRQRASTPQSRYTTSVLAAAILVLTLIVPGCATEKESSTGAPGQLFFHVVDGPIDDVASLNVTATAIRLKPCDSTWTDHSITPHTFNLLELQNGKFVELISQLPLANGTYCESRLVLDEDASVQLLDGTVHPLHIPSASSSGFKIKGEFPIDSSMATLVTVDFDAKESLHKAGGKYVLKPVIHVQSVLQFPAPPNGSTATVLTPQGGGALVAPTFELSALPGSVSAPTLIWCTQLGSELSCGPDGTSFDEPINIAMKMDTTGVLFDDTRMAIITRDSAPLYTVVDETTGWLYTRTEHFTGFKNWVLEGSQQAFTDYFGSAVIARIGLAGGLRTESVALDDYHRYLFKKTAGERQTFCVEAEPGKDVDLYASWAPGVTKTYNGSTLSGGDTRFIATSAGQYDCISLDITQTGILYVAVHGKTAAKFTPRLFTTNPNQTPSWLHGKLYWPIDECGSPTFPKYGPFNSPWGNHCEDPFYLPNDEGVHYNKLHTAVDVACPANTVVKAACSGTVKKVGVAGTDWGNFVTQKCPIEDNGTTHEITIAYVHLDQVYVGDPGTPIAAEAPIGRIKHLSVDGEVDHLHYAICVGDCNDAPAVKKFDAFDGLVRMGASYQRINPDCRTNWQIYIALPQACAPGGYAYGDDYCP